MKQRLIALVAVGLMICVLVGCMPNKNKSTKATAKQVKWTATERLTQEGQVKEGIIND